MVRSAGAWTARMAKSSDGDFMRIVALHVAAPRAPDKGQFGNQSITKSGTFH